MPMQLSTLGDKKAETHECIVINDGQPIHRYVQQAVPARYGSMATFYYNQLMIDVIMI